jgi:signal peptidase II
VAVLAVAVLTIAVDLGTKAWARAALADGAVDLGWVSLRLAENPGVAFSLGANAPVWVVSSVTTLAVVALAIMAMRGTLHPPAAAGLLLGGGLGNLIDRLQDGTVTDMIDFGWFPSFNVADIALNVGVGLVLLWGLFLHDATDDDHAATDHEDSAADQHT